MIGQIPGYAGIPWRIGKYVISMRMAKFDSTPIKCSDN